MMEAQTEREATMQTIERLQAEGFFVHEVGHRLPNGLVADLLAVRGDETLVVEVKRRADLEQVLPIAEYVESQPGWRFELVTFEPASPVPSPDWVHTLAHSAATVLRTVSPTAGAILAWVAVESGLRLLAEHHEIAPRSPSVGTLIAELYSEDVIGERRYQMLREGLDIRNQVVHGLPYRVASETVEPLVAYATALGTGIYPALSDLLGWFEENYERPEKALFRDPEDDDWYWGDLGPHRAADVLASEFPQLLPIDLEDAVDILEEASMEWAERTAG